jgi:hypothetical protein
MKLSKRIGTGIGIVTAAGLAALMALTGTAHASGTSAAAACRAWTGAHPSYAVRLTGVDAVSPCDIWATGVPGVNTKSATVTDLLHWNGVKWTLRTSATVPASLSQPPAVTAVSADDAWVAGTYVNTGADFAQTLTARWNGTAFTQVASRNPALSMGDDSLDDISAAGANNIWSVGFYSLFDTNYGLWASLPLTEHWNGHAWSWVPAAIPAAPPTAPTPLARFNAVTAVCGCGAWAVGDDQLQSTPTSNARQITLAEHWNGVKWTIVPSPSPGVENGKPNGALLGVAVISARDAWAVGDYVNSSGGKDQSLVLHWNGSSWQRVAIAHLGPKGSTNVLTAVSASASGHVIAAGYYSGVAGQQALVVRLP